MLAYNHLLMESYKEAARTRLEVQGLKDLPPLPLIAERILEVLEDDSLSVETFVGIIEQDPGLSARLLGLANSAFFGLPGRIDTLEAAIIRVLGFDIVKSLALSMAVSSVFDARRCPQFDLERYWAVAMTTAMAACELCKSLPYAGSFSEKHLYLCGLLHNVGLLALVHCCPDEIGQALEIYAGSPEDGLSAAEQRTFGCDHHHAGGWLGRKWHLPSAIVNVIEHHAAVDYRGDNAREVRLIGCAARLANRWLYGASTDEQVAADAAALGIAEAALAAHRARLEKRVDEIRQTASHIT